MEVVGKIAASAPSSMDSYIGSCPVTSMPNGFRFCSQPAARHEAIPRTLGAWTAIPIYPTGEDRDVKVRASVGFSAGSQASSGFREANNLRRASLRRVATSLAELAHVGPYLAIAPFLDSSSLNQLDASCRLLRDLNRGYAGPWFSYGMEEFRGLELADEGTFHPGDGTAIKAPGIVREDWKRRVVHFRSEVQSFRAPFDGFEISEVQQPDEIAYCRCHLRTDLLNVRRADDALGRVFMEFEISKNPDNVSLAVVDFEAGGCSSVTFSPDTGAVIRERKVNETPRKVEGSYIQPLDTITAGQCFEGFMGLYYCAGHLAFFRRHAYTVGAEQSENDPETPSAGSGNAPEMQLGPWETTGFVTDISWADGCRLTPCLAFRNEGSYKVRMVRTCLTPPIMPERNATAYKDGSWNSLDWDATEQDALEG